jgi:hypothetical protein
MLMIAYPDLKNVVPKKQPLAPTMTQKRPLVRFRLFPHPAPHRRAKNESTTL